MKPVKLIKVTVELLCEDIGLNNTKIASGYVKNVMAMHRSKYVEVSKDGNSTTERVKIHRIETCADGQCTCYLDF